MTVRIIVGLIIRLSIAMILTFIIVTYLNGNLYILYYSYASDLIIPFSMYFLFAMNKIQIKFLRKWFVKASIVFGAATFTEIIQAFGVCFLGV